MIKLYELNTKINHGGAEGKIVSVRFDGFLKTECITYQCSFMNEGNYQLRWLYDYEFTAEVKKISLKFSIV